MKTPTTEAQAPKITHTPGPWIAGEVNGSGARRVFSTNDPNNQLYCTVETGWV